MQTLLAVTSPGQDNQHLEIVADIAREVDAHLSVLVTAFSALPPVSEVGAMTAGIWIEQRQAALAELEARTEAVSEWLAHSSISGDVASDYPELSRSDDIIGRRARYADMTVVVTGVGADRSLNDKAIEGALFSSGKPLLVVPGDARVTLRPKRVMIGWDHRVEASRAVREAMSMLDGADDVRLVLVDPADGEFLHGAEPGADAATYLARHGVKVTVDRLPSGGHSVATVLRRHALDCAADLLVMGAYGHSRLRERILGGVTRSMLEAPTLPLFTAR